MTIAWLQLVGDTRYDSNGRPDFSGQATSRAWTAFRQVEQKFLTEYDGAAWLAQGGYERVALHLEFRLKNGRSPRWVAPIGRLLNADFSVSCPQLEELSATEIEEFIRPSVHNALQVVGELRKLGPIPPAGQGGDLVGVPLRPLIEDPEPYDEAPGDCFVITRSAPDGLSPALMERYERELAWLLSDEAQAEVIEAETSSDGLRWTVRVGREAD